MPPYAASNALTKKKKSCHCHAHTQVDILRFVLHSMKLKKQVAAHVSRETNYNLVVAYLAILRLQFRCYVFDQILTITQDPFTATVQKNKIANIVLQAWAS